ncbi:MAG: hypothetical protein ACLR1A_02715 [Eubacterium ventriosum]
MLIIFMPWEVSLYQENDIMLAASFEKCNKQKKPIVIVVGLGCGNGGRAGGSP